MKVKLLYDSENFALGSYESSAKTTLLITFSALILPRNGIQEESWNKFRYGFRESYCLSKSINSFFIVAKKNHWYETNDFFTMLDVLKNHYMYRNANYKILHGASMGAYGAMLSLSKLQVEALFLGSPQFSIDNKVATFENRWLELRKELNLLYNNAIYNFNNYEGWSYIFLDPLHLNDVLQLSLVNTCKKNCNIIELEGADHMAFLYLKKIDLLDKVTEDVINSINPKQRILEYKRRLLKEIQNLNKVKKICTLKQTPDILRELSIVYQNDIKIQVNLLMQAHKLRPTGPLINKLLQNALEKYEK